EREEWQKQGIGGLVSSVDATNNTITVSLPAIGEKKNVMVHISKDTILRRYAPDSIKFDDAGRAPLDQIRPGDQLRARGTRSTDGSELTAAEVVSGSFRNIAGTISALDLSAGNLTVQDLATKKPITLRITEESQLRKLPQPMAQRIAARLKGLPPDAQSSASAEGAVNARQTMKPNGPPAGGSATGGSGGSGRPGGGGSADLQQMINRMPAALLADLQKGDAVMVVATEGGASGVVTDPSGGVIGKAAVRLTGASGASLDTTTNRDGFYEFKGLVPGTYTLKAVAKGFAIFTEEGVQILAGKTQQLNIGLVIQIEEEKVEVSDSSSKVDIAPSNNAGMVVMQGKDLEALSDDPDELQSELQSLAGPSAGPNGGQIYIDGFTAGTLPPKASIREIRINQNPFSAEYDRLGYGRIEILTKPGTDQFHGQLL